MSHTEFQTLVSPHFRDLYGAAYHLTRNEKDAEDLVQDALLRAFDHFDQFRSGTNVRAWVFRILTNVFINQYRRKKRERELLKTRGEQLSMGHPYGHLSLADSRQPENEYLRTVLSNRVVSAVESIPEQFRVVVILCDLLDFNYNEASDIVGCPVGTVMSRLFRGRRLLRRRLANYAVETHVVPRSVAFAAEPAFLEAAAA